MKKSITALLAALLYISMMNAQSRIGIHITGGVIHSKVQEGYVGNIKAYASHSLSYIESTPVIGAGITFHHTAGWVFVRPSISYTQFKSTLEIRDFKDFNRAIHKVDEMHSSIDLNATAGLNFGKLRIGFGPTFHIATRLDHQLERIEEVEEKQRRLSTGFTASVGLDLFPFSVDLKYENAFSTYADHVFINNAKTTLQAAPNQLSMTLAYTLPL